MFSSNSSNIWKADEYREATMQNLKLLLQTEQGGLYGDPYFGLSLRRFTFNQNNAVLKEAIIDMIYDHIALFMPQLYIKRQDISIEQSKQLGKLVCKLKAINQIDYTIDTYNIALLNVEENL